ncbi:hypothetical protein HK097_011478 [Rhizophlyctis rosea]|uniref:Cyclin-like domain-containing protein n=1 Tax=Rhizophlyctis rosea TaxID=64517 RepID=A0AAD5X8I8_9FUNG|nr:hypothetical protein HK097_011478 [Rhizophlyctis rosea]
MTNPPPDTRPVPKEPYEESSQYKRWYLSAAKLTEIRKYVTEDAVNRAKNAWEEEYKLRAAQDGNTSPASVDDIQFITSEDQLVYCRFYETKVVDYCRAFKLDHDVQATAIAFFKRFFLINSILEHDAKLLLQTCVFLATKVENNFAREGHFDAFAKKVPKWPTLDEMLELEFSLSKGIRFDLKIQHPYLAIDGTFLDLQTYIQHTHPQPDRRTVFIRAIYAAHPIATTYADAAVRSDLVFTAMPSQIGLACWVGAVKRDANDGISRIGLGETNMEGELERFISARFVNLSPAEIADFKSRLDSIVEEIIDQMEFQRDKNRDKLAATEVDRKLNLCRNPEVVSTSLVFKERERREEEEKERRKKEKYEKVREREEEMAGVLG